MANHAGQMIGMSASAYFSNYFDVSSSYGSESWADKVSWDVADVQIDDAQAVVNLKLKAHFTGAV
ncbi:MAG: hypothetical protein Q4E41_03745 [Bacteroidales bacterium]|nr:hypothetical protein [Bacteroidales bacterium]